MIGKAKALLVTVHKDRRGSYFIEMALVVIGIALAVFTAASGLASQGIAPTYDEITNKLQNATVPDIN